MVAAETRLVSELASTSGGEYLWRQAVLSVMFYDSLIHIESQKCHLDWSINTNWM